MKTVLITGANSGFGYLTALKFARRGWHVYATTRGLEKEGVKDMNEIAGKEGLKVTWVVLDVTDKEGVKEASRLVTKESGSLDVLVNNAGFGVIGPIESYTTEDFRKQYDTNVFGVVEMTYAFLPLLKKSESGRIINISSIAGIIAAPAYGLYSSSKHALEIYSEVLRYELSGTAVKVSMIEPGGFDTSFSKNAAGLQAGAGGARWFEKGKEAREKGILSTKSGFFKSIRDPNRVANKVFSVATSRNPKLRNIVGFGTPTVAFLRKILPSSIWELIVVSLMRWLDRR